MLDLDLLFQKSKLIPVIIQDAGSGSGLCLLVSSQVTISSI